MRVATWIVGGTGQLGSSLTSLLQSDPEVDLVDQTVRWANAADSVADLAEGLVRLFRSSSAEHFDIVWAAGASVTSASPSALDEEIRVFREFTRVVDEAVAKNDLAGRTTIFLASSAGGIYAGSPHPPYSEESVPAPISGYGQLKLEMEDAVRALVLRAGIRAVIGRISNLYGPRQRIEKPQGFVSQLCKSMIYRRPMSVYVPLDTTRDYIFTDDAAVVINACLVKVRQTEFAGTTTVKNVASMVPVTLGHILHEARLVFKRKPDVILALSGLAAGQVRDLRIASTVWTDVDELPRRSLLVGLAQTMAGMQSQFQSKGSFTK